MSARRPVVARLRATPVKGFAQTERSSLTLVEGGVVDDRRFVIADASDRVLSSTDLEALACAIASWESGPDPCDVTVASNGLLELLFADGGRVAGEVVLGPPVAGRAYAGRPVPGRTVQGPFAAALSEVVGRPLRVLFTAVGVGSPGQLTILGDGSVSRLSTELGVEALDPRRFRMTVEVEGLAAHAEDSWAGRRIQAGGASLVVAGQVPRCPLMNRDPDTRERDQDVLCALLSYRDPMPDGEVPLGMYAAVDEPGVVGLGDVVRVLP